MKPARILFFKILLLVAFPLIGTGYATAYNPEKYVSDSKTPGAFCVASKGVVASILVDDSDHPGVKRVSEHLQRDILEVTGSVPQYRLGRGLSWALGDNVIIIGTLDNSRIIDELVKAGKVEPSMLSDKRETYIITPVENPAPGISKALIIAGSDKRGTIYGIYELCAQIGVSPLYFWDDVPVKKASELYVAAGVHTLGEPKVRYRGIFINDEAPALTNWVFERYGGFNAEFYEHVFEYIMRLKGNFLWPAMWGKALYDDDTGNAPLADEYGVVIGTSHHEPMMRAHVEWDRYGEGPWDYTKNKKVLDKFWKEGIRRMGSNESIVTVGMRGDGDEPMSEESNIELLEKIISEQRKIISKVTRKPAEQTPQMWALYKEVQEYYDLGMRVPDDITLMLCDDNWGNVRKLPRLDEAPRSGGYGMYYHFDYVGGPRNYKWLNTSPIARVWEQMNMCWNYGVDRIWVVNVGDIKPMEFPIEFFLDMAWDPERIKAGDLPDYTHGWAAEYFPIEHSAEIARLLTEYSKFNGRRKPELLYMDTYSLTDYREFETVVAEYNALERRASALYDKIDPAYRDAYYQLVLSPIQLCANLNEMYYAAALNHLYAGQNRVATNRMADRVQELFERDSLLTHYYHTEIAGGKWNHMMSQTHIGYTYWQQPPYNSMPPVVRYDAPAEARMGVAVEGSQGSWPANGKPLFLPTIDPFNDLNPYIEIFNTGTESFDYEITADQPWIKISKPKGTITDQQRIFVAVDWTNAPYGRYERTVTVEGAGAKVDLVLKINNPEDVRPNNVKGFVESDGYVAFEAENFARKNESDGVRWMIIPQFGHTVSGVTVEPVTMPAATPSDDSPWLEYEFTAFTVGAIKIKAHFAPTLDYHNKGLRYAISVDGQQPQIVDIHGDHDNSDWSRWVSNNKIVCTTSHDITQPDTHTVRFYAVDPGVVLTRMEIDLGGLKPSYLGAPQSFNPEIDITHDSIPFAMTVVSHSRLGKAALWSGVCDNRKAFVASNDSGCGASLAKPMVCDTPTTMNSYAPHWTNNNFKYYSSNEASLPFDHHTLLALAAPRPLIVSSGTGDSWCDPYGEFLAVCFPSPVYELLGEPGLWVSDKLLPPLNDLQSGTIS